MLKRKPLKSFRHMSYIIIKYFRTIFLREWIKDGVAKTASYLPNFVTLFFKVDSWHTMTFSVFPASLLMRCGFVAQVGLWDGREPQLYLTLLGHLRVQRQGVSLPVNWYSDWIVSIFHYANGTTILGDGKAARWKEPGS